MLALGIFLQLLASAFMDVPRPGGPDNAWWEIHKNLGLALGVLLIVHWLWTIRRSLVRGEGYLLFPWFSKIKLAALFDDLRDTLNEVRHGRLPEPDRPRPLPAALQSLGLILATALSLSGLIMVIGMANGMPLGVLGLIRDVHGAGGNLMWAYLVVHPAIAIVHEMAGQPLIRSMFTLKRNAADRPV